MWWWLLCIAAWYRAEALAETWISMHDPGDAYPILVAAGGIL